MLAVVVGIIIVLVAMADSFESVVLPRRIGRRLRPARLYYLTAWRMWRSLRNLIPAGRRREYFLSVFGPLSMLGLFACWAGAMIVGFALIHSGAQSLLPEAIDDFRRYLYASGETFFTLGYGDVTPATYFGKFIAVVEAGSGFGFMAIVIGYLPVLYQAFSRREHSIALLDARAGSPPTVAELLRRADPSKDSAEYMGFLSEWEAWSAELLESHLSFPVLSFYRSQHDNQSWLAALAVALDTSAILLVAGDERIRRRAELTFAMARHAVVDLCLVIWLPPRDPAHDRLAADECDRLLPNPDSADLRAAQKVRLNELRELYEPFLAALAGFYCFFLPRFYPERAAPDNWQTSAWTKRAPGLTDLSGVPGDEHFG